MPRNLLEATTLVAAVLSAFAAILAGMSAFMGYRLVRRVQQDLQSDDRLVAGTAEHPEWLDREHKSCVLRIAIFNKSKRKAYIDSVEVFDETENKLDVSWSDDIDPEGIPKHPSHLIGVVDSATLFVKTNSARPIDSVVRIEIGHCFSEDPLTVIFDPIAAWKEPDGGEGPGQRRINAALRWQLTRGR
jgi:hypothetical protein